jgi:hypothetical protein
MTQTHQTPSAPEKRRRIPPLVWIVLAIFVGWLVVALLQRDHDNVTPQGDDVPASVQGPSVMPATPPTGSAPATPGNVGSTSPQ